MKISEKWQRWLKDNNFEITKNYTGEYKTLGKYGYYMDRQKNHIVDEVNETIDFYNYVSSFLEKDEKERFHKEMITIIKNLRKPLIN